MSLINEQIKELRQYASERKGEIADICNRAADTIEALSEKLRASRYSDDVIQKMQELEQAELQKACEIGRELERMEQETCEDEYIKVPKKVLKYRTAGMVAYNAEWLKDHFDIERAVICGAQQPCDAAISRQAAIETIFEQGSAEKLEIDFAKLLLLQRAIKALPPVTPQPKMGHWTRVLIRNEKGGCIGAKMICSECGNDNRHDEYMKYCPNCGAKMQEVEE